MRGSVLLLDDDGITLRHGGAPNLPIEYCRLIVGLCILGAVLAPAEGLASVTIAAAVGCRFCARLGDWRGMKDHRQ